MSPQRGRRRLLAALAAGGLIGGAATPAYADPESTSDMGIFACTSFPSTADPNVLKNVFEVGRNLHASDRVMLAGFEAGWVESRMNNLTCGDRDSLGVFQQRPSQGWGTPEQILNVRYASNSFFSRAIPVADSNPGYSAGNVAQAVQRSAFPERYDQAQGTALNLLNQAEQLATGKSTVGFYRPSDASFHLTNGHDGTSEHTFAFGSANMVPIAGDWDGDGKTTIGFYRPADGSFHLKNSLAGGASDVSFVFGPPNMVPIAGDWNADGKTTVGFYRPSDGSFHLTNGHDGTAEHAFRYGPPNMKPIAGDWNYDGKSTVGFYNPADGSFHLTNENDGTSEHAFVFGPANMVPIAGDWNGDGKSTVGFYRPSDGSFHLKDSHEGGASDAAFVYGPANMRPIAGDWNNE